MSWSGIRSGPVRSGFENPDPVGSYLEHTGLAIMGAPDLLAQCVYPITVNWYLISWNNENVKILHYK